jgi:HK97 family phage prohead protease
MADENVIRRDSLVELEEVGDGRTLDLMVVPYNKPTKVNDGGPDYYEEWLPGVFGRQIKAPNRVWVNVEHARGFRDVVGKGIAFEERTDGFYGTVRLDEGPDGDKALRFINDGAMAGISLEATPVKQTTNSEGVVQRVKATLRNLALCRNPAFVDATVLAVREAPAETPEPAPDTSHTDAVLSRIGFEPLYIEAVVDRPWNPKLERFDDEQYMRSCLISRDGKGLLPVLEPDGSLNVQAMRDVAQRLQQTGLPLPLKAQAARKLLRYYRQAGETPPPALFATASR